MYSISRSDVIPKGKTETDVGLLGAETITARLHDDVSI